MDLSDELNLSMSEYNINIIKKINYKHNAELFKRVLTFLFFKNLSIFFSKAGLIKMSNSFFIKL